MEYDAQVFKMKANKKGTQCLDGIVIDPFTVVHVRYGKGITYAALLCYVYGDLLDPVFVWSGGTPSAGSSNAVL